MKSYVFFPEMKVAVQYFSVVLFIMLCRVLLTLILSRWVKF